ncbi:MULTISPECIES: DUF1351 domain-containing protein [unclassified Oceanobacillus]|uniref:DUF1351 domain-containing protein n=1 Tax=unclassified Oceanobacillus TaxID=2630292 RepID=UPI00300E1D3F
MSSLLQRDEPNVTENRHKYVGGSDVPVILGLSKFKTQYELASEKVGITKSDFQGNEYTAYGHAMEPQIREYINLTTDYEFVETSTIDEENSIRANTDGVDYDAKTLLEIKTHGAVPTIEVYKAQMQAYMFANDLEQGVLALYERPADFNLEFDAKRLDTSIIVKRDDDFIKNLLHEIELFWKRCDWLSNNRGASEWDYNNCLPENIIPGGKRPMATELEVKTVKFEPAIIEFNYEEIEKQLEENLKKYEGLTFTEKEAKECNKVIADLRKGKRLVDQYRVKTKKQLTEPIKEFEALTKKLNEKFDSVIDPLLEQSKAFDEKQREEKRIKVEGIRNQVIEDLQLADEIADQLVIEDRFLNKSTTLKSIEEELHEQTNAIIAQKLTEETQKELIKQHVEITNLKLGTELLESSYIHLIGHKENDEIKQIIEDDAKNAINQLEQKREKELKEKRMAGAEKMHNEFKQEIKPPTTTEDEEQFIEVYEVVGTESQLDALEAFMKQNNMTFKIVEEEK